MYKDFTTITSQTYIRSSQSQVYQWHAGRVRKTWPGGYHLCSFRFLIFPGCAIFTGAGLCRSL